MTDVPRLTKEQGAILSAFTGYLCGGFGDLQKYAEGKFGRPVWTHEFGGEEFSAQLKAHASGDFMALCAEADA